MNKPEGFAIMTPQNEEWAKLIEESFVSAKRVIRYAIKKDTKFDKELLQSELPTFVTLKRLKPSK